MIPELQRPTQRHNTQNSENVAAGVEPGPSAKIGIEIKCQFAFGKKLEEKYFDEEFVSEEEINGVLFLYGDGKVNPIFFEEDSDNLDEGPKFDDDGCDFVEDKVVSGDDGFIIEVVSYKDPQVLKVVVGGTIVNKSSVKDFSTINSLLLAFQMMRSSLSLKIK
ncbi:hypothetical protein Scep_005505 [Stephania cephalantha]|uniref:Uncharacterized protein n=1 Tax=Stephania cephalantha TaxID=152367 RepID=A0AAP0KUE8_9MAGN